MLRYVLTACICFVSKKELFQTLAEFLHLD